jgi:hypothetical protein
LTTAPRELLVRQLWTELAKELGRVLTFTEIATLFYEYGIITQPERPFGVYAGSKESYSLERLAAAGDTTLFLTEGIPRIIGETLNDVGGGICLNFEVLARPLRNAGYTIETLEVGDEEDGYYELYSCLPPKELAPDSLQAAPSISAIGLRTSDTYINVLLDELNDNLRNNNLNASALLTRKILTRAVQYSFDRKGERDSLKTEAGDDKELNAMLEMCKQRFKISAQVMSRAQSTKWLGDSANHSYFVRVSEFDVIAATTGLRLFLEELELISD